MKLELSSGMSLLKRGQEFPAEDLAENPFREKEIAGSGVYPLRVIRRQPAGSHDAVNMGMMLELLIPGVEDTKEADLGAEMLGIRGSFDQGFGAAAEQQTVNHGFVLQGQWCQLMG